MVDVFTKEKRSNIMSLVKGRDNRATEIRLIEIFRSEGLKGWRRRAVIFGSPDFVFTKARLAVFVDGCFWHACPIHGTVPDNNKMFWKSKLKRNKERDILVRRRLQIAGWHVVRIWQHELRNPKKVARRLNRLLDQYSMAA